MVSPFIKSLFKETQSQGQLETRGEGEGGGAHTMNEQNLTVLHYVM